MSKNELTPEQTKDIESKDLNNPEYVVEEEIMYLEDLIHMVELIYEGKAVSEIGKTESGDLEYLKIYKINENTDQKQEVLFYIEKTMPDFYKLIRRFYYNGIEPEYNIVPKK